VDLRWDQVDFRTATLHVRRVKQGTPSVHPIIGDELRALRRLQREQEPKSPFVFTSERGAPVTTAGFARMVERIRTCYGTPAAMPWLTGGTTRGHCRPTLWFHLCAVGLTRPRRRKGLSFPA
jgi:integrase